MSGSEHLNGMTEEEDAKTVEDLAAMTEEQNSVRLILTSLIRMQWGLTGRRVSDEDQ